jgi:hypothetical protein
MGAVDLRDKLLHLINTADDQYLESLSYLVESKNKENEEIVAFTIQGKPLTKEMYVEKIKETEASMKAGYFISSEELLKKMMTW